jgi:Domain of unknown function (DUF5615)
MLLYADENFAYPIVDELRQLGHDVLTAQEDGRTSTPDPDIFARAHQLGRVVLTHNRRHFERLHRQGAHHSGIVSVKYDPGNEGPVATRIDAALAGKTPGRWTIRVNRPQSP